MSQRLVVLCSAALLPWALYRKLGRVNMYNFFVFFNGSIFRQAHLSPEVPKQQIFADPCKFLSGN